MDFSRRSFIGGIIGAIAAPAVIRTPGLLMPVKKIIIPVETEISQWVPVLSHETESARLLFRYVVAFQRDAEIRLCGNADPFGAAA